MRTKIVRIIYFGIIFFLTAAGVWDMTTLYQSGKGYAGVAVGWDMQTNCGAVECAEHGEDPYDIYVLRKYGHTPLQYPYPPLSLWIMKPFCWDFRPRYLGLVLFCLVWVLFLAKRFLGPKDYALMACLILTAYQSMKWMIMTMNIELLVFAVFGLFLLSLGEKKYTWASVLLGGMAFIKILPLLYMAVFFLLPVTLTQKRKMVLQVLLTFLVLHAVSFAFYPQYYPMYIRLIFGKAPGAPALDSMTVGQLHPSLLTFIRAWVQPEGLWMTPGALVKHFALTNGVFAGIAACLALLFFKFRASLSGKQNHFKTVCYALLLIILCLPRLKPYTYIHTVLLIYFLVSDLDWKYKIATVIGICALPYGLGFIPEAWHVDQPFWGYGPLYALLSFYLWFGWLAPVPKGKGGADGIEACKQGVAEDGCKS